ncbi:MAG: zinc ribbon domain-containing protein [Pseudomonadota bacterium]
MPIYEYLCNNCGKCFEHLQFGADGSGVACPHCQSGQVSRLMSSFATGGGAPGGKGGLGLASAASGHKCGSGGFS